MTEPAAAAPAAVLVLHAPDAEPFVRGALAPALGAHEVRAVDLAAVTTPALDAALAAPHRAALVVVTPALVSEPWTRLAERLAADAARARDAPLIPLVLEDCEVPLHLAATVGLDLRRRTEWDGALARLRRQLELPAPVDPEPPCPYPGMRPYGAVDAAHFQGRDAERDDVLGRIAAGARELLIVGPSGSGKSSLIAAGVLPRLERDGLVTRTLRPGTEPARRLREALADPPPAPARLVIFIDQLEELFVQAPAAEHAPFAAALAEARAAPHVVLVLALRADFYAELLLSELWRGPVDRLDLPPLRGTALRRAIEIPARAVGVYLEPALVERLLADAANEPGALPLLQETLVALWARRRYRLLTCAAYEALGDGIRSGLAVAISAHAERALAALPPERADIARRVLLRLVDLRDGQPSTRRRQLRSQLAAGEPAAELDAVLQALAAARLVTITGDDRSPDDHVDLCHEALITAWHSFTAWVIARRADEQRRRQLQSAAEAWRARGGGTAGLLDAAELATALAWRETEAAEELGEPPAVTAHVAASLRALTAARRRRRWILAGVLAGAAAVALTVTVFVVIANRRAEAEARATRKAQQAEAEARRLEAEQLAEVARRHVADGNAQRALPYLVAARERGIEAPWLRQLYHAATRTAVVYPVAHPGWVSSLAFFPDGKRFITTGADRTARIWDVATGAAIGAPLVHPVGVRAAAVAPGGTRAVAVAFWTQANPVSVAYLWDLTAQPPARVELRHDSFITTVEFSGDGARLVTASNDGTARVWDAATGAPVSPPIAHGTPVAGARIDATGARIATLVGKGEGGLWNATTGALISPLSHAMLTFDVAFSPDGARVATAAADRTARVWNATTGEPITEPLEHQEVVSALAFEPKGTLLATVSDDHRVQLWDTSGRARVRGVLEHPYTPLHVQWSSDGANLLTIATDRVVRVWDTAARAQFTQLDTEAGVGHALLSPDGTHVATISIAGRPHMWRLGPPPRALERGEARDVVFSPDGTRIASAFNGGVRVWTRDGAEVVADREVGVMRVRFSPDGRQVASVWLTRRVWIHDLARGARRNLRTTDPEIPDRLTSGYFAPCFAWSPDGARFVRCETQTTAAVWEGERQSGPPLLHAAKVLTVAFSPDGARVLTGTAAGTAHLWDAATGRELGPPLHHPLATSGEPPEISRAFFTGDGRRIVTVAGDTVQLWDAATGAPGKQLVHAALITDAAVSPDRTRLLTASIDRSARLWDLETGALALPPLLHGGWVWSAAFDAGGARIATVCETAVHVWSAATGLPVLAPLRHGSHVHRAVFSPDGTQLATAGRDGVRLWDVGADPGSLDEWRRTTALGTFTGAVPAAAPAAVAP